MNLKLGIVILLLSLTICLSLTEGIKQNSTSISTKFRKPRFIQLATAITVVANSKKAIDVINMAIKFVTGMNDVIKLYKNEHPEEDYRNEIRAKLKDFSLGMRNLDFRITQLHNLVIDSSEKIIADNRLENDKIFRQNVNLMLFEVESKYKQDFMPIVYNLTDYDSHTVNEHLSPILNNGDIQRLLNQIQFDSELHGPGHEGQTKNIFAVAIAISEDMKKARRSCNHIPFYDKLFFYYEYIVKVVTHGYSLIIWARHYRKLLEKQPNGLYKNVQESDLRNHEDAIIKITDSIKQHLNFVDNKNWKSTHACDPKRWIEGKNYIRANRIKPKYCGDDQANTDCLMLKITWNMTNSILNLEPGSCDVEKYEVVTSARFYVNDGIIGVEPQCGVFVDSKIDLKSLRWNTWNRDHYNRSKLPQNYAELNFDMKTFTFDDITIPEGQFITAIGFKIFKGKYISLVAHGTKMYDFHGDETDLGKTFIHYPERNYQKSQHIPHFVYNYPLVMKQKSQSYEMSTPGLHHADLSFNIPNLNVFTLKDMFKGNSVEKFPKMVPVFDLSEYLPTPILPLGGIGLMYKSVPNHLGMFAFKFISTKFTSYIREDYAERLNSTLQ